MRLNLEDLPILSVGTVVHDRNFVFHDVCEITDPVFPKKNIVEINRADLISIKKLMIKVNNHDLDNVGVISKGTLDYILDMISESDFVNGNIKNIVIDMICEE